MGIRALLAGSAVVIAGLVACSAVGAATSSAAVIAAAATVREGLCTAPAAHRALASRLSTDIWNGLRGRNGAHAVSKLLTAPNSDLDAYSRSYQLALMAKVVNWEAWGVTAGTPSDVTWHVKNGWLPDAAGWHINSIGTFSGHGKNYMIAVLSDNTDPNDDEQYGIDTIEDVATLVQHDLNNAKLTGASAAAARLAANVAEPQAQPSPWAVVPALPSPARR